MQRDVRSYLTAGTVAVVGASAVALAPVVVEAPSAGVVPAPAVAEVALTGLSLSLTDVVGLLQGFGIGGGLPEVLGALQSLLPNDIVTAVVNEFVNQASPLVLAAAGEVFDYLGAAVAGLIVGPDSIPARFGDALAAIPATLVSAVQTLATGDLPTALQTVSDALAGPAAGIAAVLTEAGAAFQGFLADEFNGLVGALPGVLFAAVQTVFTNGLQSLIDTVGGALSGLLGGLIPAAGAAGVPIAAATAAPPATIVCNMPAIRTSTTLPAAAEVPPAAARTVEVAVERAAAPAVTRETATLARQSARPARSSAPKAAAVVATDAIDIAAAPDSAQPTTGKAGAEKVGRAGGRS